MGIFEETLQTIRANKLRQVDIEVESEQMKQDGFNESTYDHLLKEYESLTEANYTLGSKLIDFKYDMSTPKEIRDQMAEDIEAVDGEVDEYRYDSLTEAETFYIIAKNRDSNYKHNPAIMVKMEDEKDYGENYLKDPYFTIYDTNSFKKAKNCVRISLFAKDEKDKRARLVNHANRGRKAHLGHMAASSDQMDYIGSIMDYTCNTGKYAGMTVKDAMREELKKEIKESGLSDDKYEEIMNIANNADFAEYDDFIDERSADKKPRKQGGTYGTK